jgi:hypothetical protein
MGWKNIKKHYDIGHTVHVSEGNICIGSAYVSQIIVIGMDGTISKRYTWGGNDDLARYQREIEADKELFARLANSPDEHEKSIPVFTWDGGEIVEKFCEEPGWPNITHDGRLMYDNSFSTDKATVVAWAKKDAGYDIKAYTEQIAEKEKELEERRADLARCEANRSKLNADYPEQEVVSND